MSDQDTPEGKTADFLWKVIGRYDTYITNTVAKAALLGTFDTFVLGTVVLKWKEIVGIFAGHPCLPKFAGFFVAASAICSLISLYFLLRAVYPYLYSERKPGEYHSNVFFIHVGEHKTGEDYHAQLMKADDGTRVVDLSQQAHALALGLSKKQITMQMAVTATVVGLGSICGLLVCLLLNAVL